MNFEPLHLLRPYSESPFAYAGLVVFIVLMASAVMHGVGVPYMPFVMSAGVAGLAVVGVCYVRASSRHRRHTQQVLEAFAVSNGLRYVHGDVEVSRAAPGTLFQYGETRVTRRRFEGELEGLPFAYYTYMRQAGSGRRSGVELFVQVLEVTLPRMVPHVVIDSLLEEGPGSTLPMQFDASQRIDLEGDFSKYFRLYAPDAHGASVLALLAPDVMEVIMRYAAPCDIEIVDNKLYFYWPGESMSQERMQREIISAQAVVAKIGDKLAHRNIFEAGATSARVQSGVWRSGDRLKKNSLSGTAWTIWIACIALLPALWPETGTLLSGSMAFATVVGMGAWVAYRATRKERLQRSFKERMNDVW